MLPGSFSNSGVFLAYSHVLRRKVVASPWLTLVCLAMLQFLIALDVTIVNVALPSIGTEFGVNTGRLTWVVVGYTIAGSGLLALGGRLGDMFGRRRILVTGTLVFGIASLLAGLAWSFPILVIARIAQGIGEAFALPAAMATIVMLFPEGPRRSRALSIWAVVASSGLVLGFILSGIITDYWGWRWIFLLALPFIVLVLVGIFVLLPVDTPKKRTALNIRGAVLMTSAPLLLVYGVVEAGSGGHPALWLTAVLVAVILAGLFIWSEQRTHNPLIPVTFFRNRNRTMANLATIMLSAALSTSFLLFTLYLQDNHGLSPFATGIMLIPLAISLVIATTFIPKLLGRWGLRTCIFTGLVCTSAAMLTIALVALLQTSIFVLLLAMVLIAAGMGFGIVGLQYAAVIDVTGENAGIASGIQRAADQLGGSTGITIYLGVGFAPAFSGSEQYVVSSVLALGGLILAAILASRITEGDVAPSGH